MRSFAIEDPGSPVPPLYATLFDDDDNGYRGQNKLLVDVIKSFLLSLTRGLNAMIGGTCTTQVHTFNETIHDC